MYTAVLQDQRIVSFAYNCITLNIDFGKTYYNILFSLIAM